jgi:ABC-type microcin C transport system permease subunit YejB
VGDDKSRGAGLDIVQLIQRGHSHTKLVGNSRAYYKLHQVTHISTCRKGYQQHTYARAHTINAIMYKHIWTDNAVQSLLCCMPYAFTSVVRVAVS